MEDNYIYQEFSFYLGAISDKIERNYIEKRLINQIIWYDTKAIKKQHMYKRLTILTIALTGIIPVLSLFATCKYGFIATIFIALASATSTAIISIVNLCEYQKLWIEFRSTSEILKSILHRYFTKTGEFASEDEDSKFNLLISVCEEYMVREFQTWTELSHDYKNKEES